MKVIGSIKKIQSLLSKCKAEGKTVGFVPTMGAFHEGHLALMRKCRKENDIVVVSVFVNPTQFGPHEDFEEYPRNKKRDLLLAKKENVDIIFYPSITTMYPQSYLTYVNVEEITEKLCGKSRPLHFRGVCTVVGKLLNIIHPDYIYLGQKDAQQCIVLKQMIRDLNFSVKVKIVPIIREDDGLAMSSRNYYLSGVQRAEAPILYKSLCIARQKILKDKVMKSAAIIRLIQSTIEKNSRSRIEYIKCVDVNTLKSVSTIQGYILIALAVKFGKTRLIDNIILRVK